MQWLSVRVRQALIFRLASTPAFFPSWQYRDEIAIRDYDKTPVAWDYPSPTPAYGRVAGHLAFYPSLVDCFVDGERVRPQPGRFYGGWITDDVVGPFKGEPGTWHW